MFIDTHCHINMMVKKDFDRLMTQEELMLAKNVVTQAENDNVKLILNVATSVIESINCIEIAKNNLNVFATVGTHPNDVNSSTFKDDIQTYKKLLIEKNINKIIAIGEIGLDYHYKGFNKQLQYDTFKEQIELALTFNFPICVHTRDAHDETLKIIEEYKKDGLKGLIHCFSESLQFAQDAINLNFKIAIGATLTYPKNETLRQTIAILPLEHILLETDAPFLPPQDKRGKQNHPSEIVTVAKTIAQLQRLKLEEVEEETTKNALKLFDFNLKI